jgi:hypothetical protein
MSSAGQKRDIRGSVRPEKIEKKFLWIGFMGDKTKSPLKQRAFV